MPAVGALALVGGQIENLLGGGEVVIASSSVSLVAGLLAPAAFGHLWWRVVVAWVSGGGGIGGVMGLGLLAEEAMLEVTDLGLESCDLVLEEGLALCGALVHGLPIAGLLSGLAEGGQQGAVGTGEGAAVSVVGAVGCEVGEGGCGVVGLKTERERSGVHGTAV